MHGQEVKIAATSDLHGYLDGLGSELDAVSPDILVIAGDIHPCRLDISPVDWFMDVFLPLVKKIRIPVVAIPGNHDFFLSDVLSGTFSDWMRRYAPRNFHLLCDSGCKVRGLTFYGTPWCRFINDTWCFEASHESLNYIYSKIPDRVDVLISHTPPEINHKYIDISMDKPKELWRHYGSAALTQAIRLKKPKAVICGHIHSGDHGMCEVRYGDKPFESVPCYNVSRVNEEYKVAYPLTTITLSSEK